MYSKRNALLWGIGTFVVAGIAAFAVLGQHSQAPNRVELAFLEGTQARARGDLPEAAAKFKQTTELDAQFCSGYFDLADVYERQGKADQAIEAFQNALKCFKSDAAHSPANRSEAFRKGEIERTTKRIDKLKGAIAQSPQ